MSRVPAWKNNEMRPLEVEVRNNNLEEALKVLKNKIAKDGILTELKERRHAEKPSEYKRRKYREMLKKLRKLSMKSKVKRKPKFIKNKRAPNEPQS